jgi:hypothetical protein
MSQCRPWAFSRDKAKIAGSKMLHCTFLIDPASPNGKPEAEFMRFYRCSAKENWRKKARHANANCAYAQAK